MRYEDPLANEKNPFSLGAMIGSIEMHSTDKDWKVCFTAARREIINKVSPFYDCAS